jgi:hypothetical protein
LFLLISLSKYKITNSMIKDITWRVDYNHSADQEIPCPYGTQRFIPCSQRFAIGPYDLTQVSDWWQALVNVAMNFWVP